METLEVLEERALPAALENFLGGAKSTADISTRLCRNAWGLGRAPLEDCTGGCAQSVSGLKA